MNAKRQPGLNWLFGRLRTRIYLLSVVPIALMILILGLLTNIQQETQTALHWSEHSDVVLATLQRISNLELTSESSLERYLLTGNPRERVSLETASKALLRLIPTLPALVADNLAQVRRAQRLVPTVARRMALLASSTRMANLGNRKTAIALIDTRNARSLAAQMHVEMSRFAATEHRLSTERLLHLAKSTQTFANFVRLSIAFVIIAMGITSFLFGWFLIRRLERLRQRAKVFARTGVMLPESNDTDEIGDLDRTFTSMATTISEREATLALYRILSEHAPAAFFFVRGSDGLILEANSGARELYGYTSAEFVGLPWSALTLSESLHVHKDGTPLHVEVVSTEAEIAGEGTILYIVSDIAERLDNEAALHSALAQAVEASRLKSEFVATMSHEIRTPMNALMGMAELLLDTPLDEEQRSFVEVLNASGASLLSVINDILDFSKIEAGRIEIETISLDILAVVEGVAALLARSAHEKGISLMTFVDPQIPNGLLGDPERLRQVLVNLAGNAVKFTNIGTVSVLAECAATSDERVEVHFIVKDTGIGMSEAVIKRLFQPFTQADSSTTRKYGGTGLGLTISRRLVELMNGDIEVQSIQGEGSSFHFTLPIRRHIETAVAQTERPTVDVRVLIVDDDPDACDLLRRYISSWGFSSAEASTAEEAERLARSAARSGEPFDVALVDLRLGNGDGFDVLRCLRRDPLTSSIRAIMITAYDSASLGKTAIAAGFTGYLVKPIKQSQLFDCITGTSPSPARNARVLSASNHQNAVNGTSQFRILLAEDNAINQRLALQQLARLGYFADVVENGREAIDRSGLEHYDLILMDCQMPDIDGFEATRSIRRRESRSGDRVIIVAMTANALAEDRTACIAAGMDDYIPKPVLMGTLRATLDRWLKKAEHEASQAPSTVPSSAVLNRERLNDLFDADSAEITALLQLALHSIQRLCAQLRSTADSHDALELAHELKGTAANIGAEELSHAAESLERRLKQRDDISILTSEIETIREAEQRFADTVSGKECKV